MIRTAARKTLLLAAVTLSMGALAVNCSHKDNAPSSDIGSVGLAITLPGGATVSTVHYSVKNSAMVEVRAGDIPTSDPGATISVVLGGIPAGTGYVVALSGMASDGTQCMGASTPFAVMANMSTTVNVLLLCRGVISNGTVAVNGTVDNCPTVNSFTVSPLAVAPGGTINVAALGGDIDSTDTVTYAWSASAGSATAGTFTAPTAATTTFKCPATGSSQQTLTITVSDSVIAGTTTPKCSTPASITVSCGLCGNGTVDQGEACDPAATPTGAPANFACNSSCQAVPVCGNGVVQSGEQCDPPMPGFCSATCQNVVAACGDGFVQPAAGEQCDPPGPIAGSANTCSATCKIVMPASSGGATGSGGVASSGGTTGSGGAAGAGGRGGAGGVTGSGGATSSGGAGGAGGMSDIATAGCRTCEAAQCAPQGYGCQLLTGNARTLCTAVEACIRANKCDPDGDTSFCYCGTASQDDGTCLAGPLGPCVAVMEAADTNILATDTALQRANKIFADLVDPSIPLGKATNLMGCDAFSCNTAPACAGQF